MIIPVYIGTWSPYLYILDFDTDSGDLVQRKALNVGNSPSWIALNPACTHLFTVNETDDFENEKSGGILSYQIEKGTGELTLVNSAPSKGAAPCYLVVDYSGQHIAVANYMGSTFCTFALENGAIAHDPIQVITKSGSGPKKQQDASHPHMFALDPNQQHALLIDLGLDKIFQYKYDIETGQLEPNPNGEYLEVEPGSGPRHIGFHPNGKFAYIVTELSSMLLVCDYNFETGVLSQPKQKISLLPTGVNSADNSAAEIEVTPDGRFLYASNRGASNSIAICKLDDEGKVSLVGHQDTDQFPRHFTTFGDFMIVTNQNSNNVQVFKRDIDTGLLSLHTTVNGLEKPVCARFLF